jgi:hypothetical protein
MLALMVWRHSIISGLRLGISQEAQTRRAPGGAEFGEVFEQGVQSTLAILTGLQVCVKLTNTDHQDGPSRESRPRYRGPGVETVSGLFNSFDPLLTRHFRRD